MNTHRIAWPRGDDVGGAADPDDADCPSPETPSNSRVRRGGGAGLDARGPFSYDAPMGRVTRKRRSTGQAGLVLGKAGARLAALTRERARLMKEIAARKRELDRARMQIEATATEVMAAIAPFLEQQQAVEAEIHALFASLLAPGRLAKRRRAGVRKVYAGLQEIGLVSPPPLDAVEGGGEFEAEGWSDYDFDDSSAAERHGPRPGQPAGPSADKPTDDKKHGTLRALFKRLVVALHPDRAVQEDEKARRTAAMKDLTRAYEAGDLARMIELGDRLTQGIASEGGAEDSVALEALERAVAELKAQLRQLLDEWRSVRHSEQYRTAQELQRAKNGGEDPIEDLREEAQEELDDLIVARDFVASFAAGKITLAEFLRGPRLPSDSDDFLEFIDDVLGAIEEKRQTSRRHRRRVNDDDIPF